MDGPLAGCQQDPQKAHKNHKGATEYPAELQKYIEKELKHEAVMGPYKNIPFKDKVGISPLSSRPKKNSEERRIILDLSFPLGDSINDGIDKDHYLGFEAKLTFPKVDELAIRIHELGKGCMMFKIDLSTYFRQIPLDPGDYPMIGYVINGQIYFDKVLPMGMRSAPYIAQRITNAIAYIHRQLQYFLLNYVDDFVGAELEETVWKAYLHLKTLLDNLQVDTSPEKLIPPTTRLEFLGITFDSVSMTMEISEEKVKEIQTEVRQWLNRTTASRKELESLIGKLQFVAKCVKAGRIFIGRLINWLKGMDRKHKHRIPNEARKDITWWGRFMEKFNGLSIMWLMREPKEDRVLATDACLKGYGGVCGKEYFRGRFPKQLQEKNIATLEIWAVMAALKLWGNQLQGKYFWILVYNEAVASVLNSGRGRDTELQDALREIAFIVATHQFVLKAKHIPGVQNRLPDYLSRWDNIEARKAFRNNIRDQGYKYRRSSVKLLELQHSW